MFTAFVYVQCEVVFHSHNWNGITSTVIHISRRLKHHKCIHPHTDSQKCNTYFYSIKFWVAEQRQNAELFNRCFFGDFDSSSIFNTKYSYDSDNINKWWKLLNCVQWHSVSCQITSMHWTSSPLERLRWELKAIDWRLPSSKSDILIYTSGYLAFPLLRAVKVFAA